MVVQKRRTFLNILPQNTATYIPAQLITLPNYRLFHTISDSTGAVVLDDNAAVQLLISLFIHFKDVKTFISR